MQVWFGLSDNNVDDNDGGEHGLYNDYDDDDGLQVWFGLSDIQTKLAGLGLTDSQADLEDQQIPR